LVSSFQSIHSCYRSSIIRLNS